MKVFKPELRFIFSFFLSFKIKQNPERVNKTLEQRQTTMGTNILDIRRAGRCLKEEVRRKKTCGKWLCCTQGEEEEGSVTRCWMVIRVLAIIPRVVLFM